MIETNAGVLPIYISKEHDQLWITMHRTKSEFNYSMVQGLIWQH